MDKLDRVIDVMEKMANVMTDISTFHHDDMMKIIDSLEMLNKRISVLENDNNMLNKIWIYSIQDDSISDCGGFIIADIEEEAREKLFNALGKSFDIDKVFIYPFTSLELTNDIHELW